MAKTGRTQVRQQSQPYPAVPSRQQRKSHQVAILAADIQPADNRQRPIGRRVEV